MKRVALKRYTPLRSYTGLRPVSRRQSRENYRLAKVVKLCKVRCNGRCEVRGPDCLITYGITPHHIISRARGGSHSVSNIIMGCAGCHDHGKYKDGIPLVVEFALGLVEDLNDGQ